MGLINFIQRIRAGKTDFQKEARYGRANARASDYMAVAQWYVENCDDPPHVLQNFTELDARGFRAGHKAILYGFRNDIERKLGHARHIGTRQNPWIAAFERPADQSVYCAYVLLRDDKQNFAVMKPYWFLSAGEQEKDYRSDVMNVI
jgi:hypothetical protein